MSSFRFSVGPWNVHTGAPSMMALIPYEIDAMKRVVRNKLELFGSVGHADGMN